MANAPATAFGPSTFRGVLREAEASATTAPQIQAFAVAQLQAVHRLTLALHRGDSPSQLYEEAVGVVVEVLGVDRASLLLFDPDGVMRFKAWRGLSETYRRAVEGHTPWSEDDADAQSITVEDVAADAGLAPYLPVLETEGVAALAFVPLLCRGRVVGKFMLYYDRRHNFSDSELSLAEILAAHVALALDRQAAEEALRRSEHRLRRVLASSTEAFIATDRWGRITEWNEQAKAIFGWRREETLGLSLAETVIASDHGQVYRQALERLLATGEGPLSAPRLELHARRRDGSVFPVEVALWAVEEDAEVSVNALLHDISERRRREKALVAARAEAEGAAARLAVLARVTAALSSAVSVDDVAEVVLGAAKDELGAATGSVCLLRGDEIEIAYAVGYSQAVLGHWKRFPLAADLPASEAVRTGRPIFVGSPAERDARYPVFASTPVLGDQAFAAIPFGMGRPLGCLVVGFAEARTLGEQDESFFSELAGRCGAALERARLYEERAVIAQTLQSSLLPPQLPEIPGVELAARYVAAGSGVEVGGDFYDVFRVDARRFAIVLGDVCGRGVSAASIAALCRHIVRSAVVTTTDPAAILAHVNEVLLLQAPDAFEPRFCTALVGVGSVTPDGVRIRLALGGHPHPLVRRSDGTVVRVGTPGSLLGVMPDTRHSTTTVVLREGEALVCVTDGVLERRRAGADFGEAGLATVVASRSEARACALAGEIERAVASFSPEGSDDLAVLVVGAAERSLPVAARHR